MKGNSGGYQPGPGQSTTPPQGYGNGPGPIMHPPMGPPHHMGPPPMGAMGPPPPTGGPNQAPPHQMSNSHPESMPPHPDVSGHPGPIPQDNGVPPSSQPQHPVTSIVTTGPDGAGLDEASQQSTLSNASAG